VKQKKLKILLNQIFQKHNLSKDHSKIVSDYLIKAELLDAPSHGLARLKMYCDRIKEKLINPKPNIKIKKISNSISHVDANDSIGFVAADIGIKQAIKNAKKTGIGLVAIKKSGHYGLSSFYAEQAVKNNLIVFCFTNAPPALAPYGAKKSLFGTNPICFGAPTGKAPFILDASTSMINRGKIRRASKLGQKIPYGVALDKYGQITIDANKALEGTQLPISTFKGSGLAWMVDILSGVLTGSSHSGKTKDPFDDFSGPQNMGHLFITFDPKIFIGKNFIKEMKINISRIKRLPKAKGFKSILYPGERKNKIYRKNLNKDISIPSKILNEINELNAIE
jgi:L-2-hydroxycarboxylate dehydrogenase (NAD+)|tara:strand:- start:527 stop:1537 length:1011 start_codon:yes stop_codon:yes gene_type:complete